MQNYAQSNEGKRLTASECSAAVPRKRRRRLRTQNKCSLGSHAKGWTHTRWLNLRTSFVLMPVYDWGDTKEEGERGKNCSLSTLTNQDIPPKSRALIAYASGDSTHRIANLFKVYWQLLKHYSCCKKQHIRNGNTSSKKCKNILWVPSLCTPLWT